MHQPMDPLPSIFSLGDLVAMDDDKWDMDASLFDGFCSPFAPANATGCILPAVDERGGSTSPLGQKRSGFYTLPASFAGCSGTVASASVSQQQSMSASAYSFDFLSDTGPSLAGRAQSLETQLQGFGNFASVQKTVVKMQSEEIPVQAFGICSEAGQSLAGRAQAAALEEHHLMGGDLRSELLRGKATAPSPQYNYSGELGGSSQIGQQIAGWVSSNGNTFLEASQTAAVAVAAAAAAAVQQYTTLPFVLPGSSPAPQCCPPQPANAPACPAPISASCSVSPANLASEAALKLRSDAGSRDSGLPPPLEEGGTNAAGKVASREAVAGASGGSGYSSTACHSTIRAAGSAAPSAPARSKITAVQPSYSSLAPQRVGAHSGRVPLALGSGSEGDERVTKRCSGSRFDDMIDPSSTPEERRRQRRMLSNRESARRSRRRKENFLQTAEEQLSELAVARAAAAASAGEAAQDLAVLLAKYVAVSAERDSLRKENERLCRKMKEAGLSADA